MDTPTDSKTGANGAQDIGGHTAALDSDGVMRDLSLHVRDIGGSTLAWSSASPAGTWR